MATKGGVVDKSEALAPTYPPMRNSDLRSSNYVGLIFSSQIEEYVGAKGNTLVDHKKERATKNENMGCQNQTHEKTGTSKSYLS